VQRLLMVRDRARDRDATLRLVIPQGSMVRRILALLDVDHLLPVYASLVEASTGLITAAQDPFTS
jgi:hypothetical protein